MKRLKAILISPLEPQKTENAPFDEIPLNMDLFDNHMNVLGDKREAILTVISEALERADHFVIPLDKIKTVQLVWEEEENPS